MRLPSIFLSLILIALPLSALEVQSVDPAPGSLTGIIEQLRFNLDEPIATGNFQNEFYLQGIANGSEVEILGFTISGNQIDVFLNEKMLSGNIDVVLNAENLFDGSGNSLSGDNVFSYEIGQPSFDRIEIEREDGKFIVEGKVNFGTSVPFNVPVILGGNAVLNEHYQIFFYLDDDVDSILSSTNLLLPVIFESDEVKMVFKSTNLLTSEETRTIEIDFYPGEGYFMNQEKFSTTIYVQGTEMLTQSELETSIITSSTRTLIHNSTSGNTFTWTLSGVGEGFSAEAFSTPSTTINTSSNIVYFHAGDTAGVSEIQVLDGTTVVKDLLLTVFEPGQDDKFLEPEARFSPFQDASDYLLVSFPLALNSFSEFDDLMRPLLGEMNSSNYLIYGYDTISQNYLLADDPALPFARGRAFWMARVAGGKVEFLGDATAFTEQITLTLGTGWQMVGNPYGDAFKVSDIAIMEGADAISLTSDQNTKTDPYIWGLKDNPSDGDYYEITPSLEPMEGGWLYVIDSSVTLVFSPRLFSDEIQAFKPRSSTTTRQPPDPPTGSATASAGGGGCLLKSEGILR